METLLQVYMLFLKVCFQSFKKNISPSACVYGVKGSPDKLRFELMGQECDSAKAIQELLSQMYYEHKCVSQPEET